MNSISSNPDFNDREGISANLSHQKGIDFNSPDLGMVSSKPYSTNPSPMGLRDGHCLLKIGDLISKVESDDWY